MKRNTTALILLGLWCAGRTARADEPFSLEGAKVSGTQLTKTETGLKIDFGNKEDYPNIFWNAPSPQGWDWHKYNALVLTLSNPSDENLSFHVKIGDHNEAGRKHNTQLSGSLAGGQTGRFYVSLESRTLREKSGMRYLPPIIGDYGQHLGGGVEPGHIDQLQIFRATPKTPATLILKSIVLSGEATNPDLNAIIDQYGQYTRADWPGKIHSDADFLAQKNAEKADLAAHKVPAERSQWGGWTAGPRQRATGFFRTQLLDGKWWLVDPEGYLFLSTGIDVIRSELSTRIEGRRDMFTWLPQADDPLAKYYGGVGKDSGASTFSFLRANLERKFGPDFNTEFGARAVERLRSWGFNTIGNWSPEEIGRQLRFPYVVAAGTSGPFATVPGHNNSGMPDPFDPAFATAVEKGLAPKAALAKNDPACIGYFVDNELPWGMPNVDGEHFALCYGALSLDENSPAKQQFVSLLMGRYRNLEQFNASWHTKLASWDELKAPFKVATAIQSDAQRQDFSDFLSLYADKYFEVVSQTVKRYDPNHLYLGCRFAFWFTPEAVKSAAKYADVISFNIYTWNRDTFQFAQHLGKPCIVGEFHFGALDRGMFSGNITVKDQNERGKSYAAYVQSVLSEPGFIGCHWFQYYDEPTTGRDQDGENFNIGFASTTDTPYTELIQAARAANAQIYEWHRKP